MLSRYASVCRKESTGYLGLGLRAANSINSCQRRNYLKQVSTYLHNQDSFHFNIQTFPFVSYNVLAAQKADEENLFSLGHVQDDTTSDLAMVP